MALLLRSHVTDRTKRNSNGDNVKQNLCAPFNHHPVQVLIRDTRIAIQKSQINTEHAVKKHPYARNLYGKRMRKKTLFPF